MLVCLSRRGEKPPLCGIPKWGRGAVIKEYEHRRFERQAAKLKEARQVASNNVPLLRTSHGFSLLPSTKANRDNKWGEVYCRSACRRCFPTHGIVTIQALMPFCLYLLKLVFEQCNEIPLSSIRPGTPSRSPPLAQAFCDHSGYKSIQANPFLTRLGH